MANASEAIDRTVMPMVSNFIILRYENMSRMIHS